MSLLVLWIEFIFILFLIYISGERLSFYGDRLSSRIGISEGLIGVTLISAVTSLPELFTGISAVNIVKDNNMLFGEILGSCIFNLTIVSIMSFALKKSNLFTIISKRFKKTSLLTGGLLLSVAFFLKVRFPSIGFIGLQSIIITFFYFGILKIIYNKEFKPVDKEEKSSESLLNIVLKFSIASVVIIATGLYLPVLAKKIAIKMDWTSTFMGLLFIAMITSLPELVVSYSAAKRGFFGIAIGNIFGSIIFNILILSIVDIFYIKGTIWKIESWSNFWTAVVVGGISIFAAFSGKIIKSRISQIIVSLIIIILYILVLSISFVS